MKIIVTWGVGGGSTKLSSFDKALYNAGIANYNLIPLSSVIPLGSDIEIKKVKLQDKKEDFGKKLWVVIARATVDKPNQKIFAGVGWVFNQKEKKGLFVEHHGNSREEVRNLIERSLTDMIKYRVDIFGPINYKITGVKCLNKPVSALVCAIYQVESW